VPKKLFELIVVNGQLRNQVDATRKDLQATFEKKRHLFEEKRKTFTANREGAEPVVEEVLTIQSTVEAELKWMANLWSKSLDNTYQVACGNALSKADVVLDDGTVLLRDVPGTALMDMEARFGEFQALLNTTPTLDPSKGFEPDPSKGPGVYQAREVRKPRTQKVPKPIVLYHHSPEHPAQTQLITLDEPVGTIQEQEWSGMITPARKAELLDRCETLRRALKTALQRSNTAEVPDPAGPVSSKLFEYVLKAGS